jgi:hypothetical protein
VQQKGHDREAIVPIVHLAIIRPSPRDGRVASSYDFGGW